jgi:hypothetical protein
MTKKITEIPYLGILIDCFPDREKEFYQMEESEVTNEEWWIVARWWRNILLKESDWSQVSDNSLSEIQREQWKQYRQELRDITDTVSNPKNIVFPDMPSK